MPILDPPCLAIFDHDGVLVDSLAFHQLAWQELARRTGLPLTPEFIHETFGMTNPSIFRKLLGDAIREEEICRYGALKEECYRDAARGRIVLMDGVRELLDALTAAGVQLAIGSSGPRANLELTVATCGLTGRFAAITSLEDIHRGKPDPEVFLVTAAKAGVAPARSVVFEDAPVGIQAAKAAGMYAVGVGRRTPWPPCGRRGPMRWWRTSSATTLAPWSAGSRPGPRPDPARVEKPDARRPINDDRRLEAPPMLPPDAATPPIRTVAILGAGGMGTALALLWAREGRSVRLWARDPARAAEMARTRENAYHLPGVSLPPEVHPTADAAEATAGADLLVAAIPSAFLRATLAGLAGAVPGGVPVLSVVKGIENETFARPSQIIADVLGARPIAVLSGPSHAEEIAHGLPASVVIAGADAALNEAVRDSLTSGMFRIYTNPDALGVELAGALKNILGIAAGICDGLAFGDNAKAALLTRGLVEIARFAADLGARPATFFGLAGVGDLITTCYSPFGRNRALGIKIGRGAALADALAEMRDVAEGVYTTRSVHAQAQARGVEMPITAEVYQILFEGKPPTAAVTDLMLRMPKMEWP
ncbi:MAG: NAD(P)H-dependent glycerol-3-phosphate dehydrogenase [Isosphaeraceae bacterium]|nr:NAD(P)H-dependent glycerol-3-phosphate dehydrogenase [Isosphaeraceae bacterium]